MRSPYMGTPVARCDICRKNFNFTMGAYVCDDADINCDYDCCPACFKGNVASKGTMCSEGLPLQYSTAKRDRYWGYGAICNVC